MTSQQRDWSVAVLIPVLYQKLFPDVSMRFECLLSLEGLIYSRLPGSQVSL